MDLSDAWATCRNYVRAMLDCRGCQARDMHILSLKEMIRQKDEFIMQLELKLEEANLNNVELINHLTGKRAPTGEVEPAKLHSIPTNRGMSSRIARAERMDREQAAPVIKEREAAYRKRIDELIKPATELVEDGTGGA